MKCHYCENECREGALFCNICGTRLKQAETAPAQPVFVKEEPVNEEPANEEIINTAEQYAKEAQQPISDNDINATVQAVLEEKKEAQQTQTPPQQQQSQQTPPQQTPSQQTPPQQTPPPVMHTKLSSPYDDGEERAKVVSTGKFVLMDLVMMIPLVNLIMYFVWGFSSKVNPNIRNWARGKLVWILINIAISIIVSVIISIVFAPYIAQFFENLSYMLENSMGYLEQYM